MRSSLTFCLGLVLSPLLAASQYCGSACDLYTMVFSDPFDGDELNTTTWQYRTDAKDESAQLAANVDVSDGCLVINLKEQSVDGYDYTAGGVVSYDNFHYGYFEAYMSDTSASGFHTSFWLMAGNGSTTYVTKTSNHSEIDVYETDSAAPAACSHNINLWNGDGDDLALIGSGSETTSYDFQEWNVFSALWTETFVAYYINNALQYNASFPASRWTHDYLNIWLSSVATGTITNSQLPSTVQTGNVSYYQKDYYLTSSSLCRNPSQTTACISNQGYAETGSWSTSGVVYGYTLGLATRYSCSVAGVTASWTMPSWPVSGTFELSIWNFGRSDSDPSTHVVVEVGGAQVGSTYTVDQTTGTAGWDLLNSDLALSAGKEVVVKLTASGSGCARADSVKFIRVA